MTQRGVKSELFDAYVAPAIQIASKFADTRREAVATMTTVPPSVGYRILG